MARPAKPISVTTGARTKEELTIRAEVEQSLNSGKPPKPPKYLTQEQKKIFKEILKNIGEGLALCSADIWILSKTSIAINKLIEIDTEIENAPAKKYEKSIVNARRAYTQDFYRGCNELGLSPQARAKLAIAAQTKSTDPLAGALDSIGGGLYD